MTHHSPVRKKLGRFFSLFSTITLIITIIVFFVFILQGIPLKYIIGFLFTYTLMRVLALVLNQWHDTSEKHTEDLKKYTVPLFAGINIVTLGLLILLIERYQLSAYRIHILSISCIILNIILLEYTSHYISHFIRTHIGTWVIRTLLLLIFSWGMILTYNTLREIPWWSATLTSKPQKTSSEITGVLTTIDPTKSADTIRSSPIWPWNSLTRSIGIGNTGTDVLAIQTFLQETGYLTGSLSSNYDSSTATALNRYIRDTTGEVFTRPEFGTMKLTLLKSLSPSTNSEATGTLSTPTTGKDNIRIDSIDSVDGMATAKIENGKIVVQVISPTEWAKPSSTNSWQIQSSVTNNGGAGGLKWVVISAPLATPRGWSYDQYQSITLSAEGASGIFFTIDGSDPSCQGKWSTTLTSKQKTIQVKAISCFWGNRIRGPISSYTFTQK